MSIFVPTPTNTVLPHQLNGAGAWNATMIDQFNGIVEDTLKRRSYVMKFAKPKTVKGAQTISKRSSGISQLQVMTRGDAPAGTDHDFGLNKVTVDTKILAREVLWDLDEIQADFDVRAALARGQGEAHARKLDEVYFIAGLKAAKATASPYGTPGFSGGSQEVITSAEAQDPAALMLAISDLLTKMQEKDVVPQQDGVCLYMRPAQFNLLMQHEQVINGEYVTADGTKLSGIPMFKAYGVPCFITNNAPFGKNVTAHELSNADNSNFYNGDFTKDLILAVSDRAVFMGQSMPITSRVWFSDPHHAHVVDTWAAYGMNTDRTEFAGVISVE